MHDDAMCCMSVQPEWASEARHARNAQARLCSKFIMKQMRQLYGSFCHPYKDQAGFMLSMLFLYLTLCSLRVTASMVN